MRAAIAVLSLALIGCLAWFVLTGRPDPSPVGRNETRIVSLSPTLTETVFDLGAGNLLVGVTSYCTYPADARRIEKVGDFINPNTEKIVSLRPTLVLAQRWTSSRIVPKLSTMGLRVVEIVSPASIQEIDLLIRQVGEALGRNEEAGRLIEQMHGRMAAIQRRAKRSQYRPSVYLEIDPPSWTIGRRSFTSEAITLAGGRNLFDDMNIASLLASKEEIVRRNPDLIIAFSALRSEIAARPGWNSIRAVQEGRVVDDFDRDLLSRGSFRLVEGIEQLAAIIENTATADRSAADQKAAGEKRR